MTIPLIYNLIKSMGQLHDDPFNLQSNRVYDNAYANAELQKAQLIMSLEEKATRKSRQKFLQFVRKQCNPISDYYDDDEEASGGKTTSIQKITHQTYVSTISLNRNRLFISDAYRMWYVIY